MKAHPVFRHIDPEALARDTLEFVSVNSETGREGEGSRFFAELLRREGFEPRLDEIEPGRPNVYARIEGTSGHARSGDAPTLMLNGHTDTIPVGDSAVPAREGDWVVGRGAEDMKGGLVAMVHAASALRQADVQLAGDLWLTGVIGHETPIGQKEGPRRLIHLLRTGQMRADAILIAEGPSAIWAASLGSTLFTITITSDRGPVHTLQVPYADNPARWAGRLLMEFERMEERFAAAPKHPLCGRERLNVGIVSGGDYPNRLPTPVSVIGKRRWTPGRTGEEVHAELLAICDRLAAESGLTFSAALEGQLEPFETPPDHPIVRALQTAGESVSGKTPEVIGMALLGDANSYVNEGGVPTVYYGPGCETAHSDRERVSAAQLAHCARMYGLAAMAFCGASSGAS